MQDNSDLEWFERFKKECEIAGFAVTCPKCLKVMRDIKAPNHVQLNNCFCSPAIDYDEVARAHGLGLFASMFHSTDSPYVHKKLGLAR